MPLKFANENDGELAQQGSSLSLEATVFVPGSDEQDRELAARVLPKSFLGLIGCLERICFAVDPFSETFTSEDIQDERRAKGYSSSRRRSDGLAFGVSALVGLISGILPAIRAARLEPVEALRSER